jgi:Xaa-Pro aminopeptidase
MSKITTDASFERLAGLPFSVAEYRARCERVRAEMKARDIDVLYVTSPANLFYLCGYEAIWYPNRLPLGAVVDRTSEQLVVFDWTRHEGYVNARVLCDETVLFDYGNAAARVTEAFAQRGWLQRTVGLEWNSPNPSATVMVEVGDMLSKGGATVVSGDWVVDQVRLYKSAAELDCIRRAARFADGAMLQLGEVLRPGMTEIEVAAHLASLLAQAGSEPAATSVLVNSGPTAWMDVHTFPSHRKLAAGDVVSVDCCGVVNRYHANLGRTFAIGKPNEHARRMLELACGGFDELQRSARIGESPRAAAAAAEAHIRERIAAEHIWWIGGYALGIAFPPSWVGHTYLADDGVQRCSLLPGYVSNFETMFFDRRQGFEVACIDTLVMTGSGLELLSAVPRKLLEVAT